MKTISLLFTFPILASGHLRAAGSEEGLRRLSVKTTPNSIDVEDTAKGKKMQARAQGKMYVLTFQWNLAV